MNITKTGQLKDVTFVEPFITLNDGSQWQLLLFHIVNNGSNLFTKENCKNCNLPGCYSKLQWIDSFKYNNQYEFYVIQDGVEHRWIQTNAPMTTTSVTGFNKISGTVRGGICKNTQKAALAISSTTPWWNACGSYTGYTVGSKTGIPGFGPTTEEGICSNYLALYARIESINAFIEKTNTVQSLEFYEY